MCTNNWNKIWIESNNNHIIIIIISISSSITLTFL